VFKTISRKNSWVPERSDVIWIVRQEYLSRVIDPAVVPDRKIESSRLIISTIGTMLGIFIALIVVFVPKIMTTPRFC
jgi:hypothetical protein